MVVLTCENKAVISKTWCGLRRTYSKTKIKLISMTLICGILLIKLVSIMSHQTLMTTISFVHESEQ